MSTCYVLKVPLAITFILSIYLFLVITFNYRQGNWLTTAMLASAGFLSS